MFVLHQWSSKSCMVYTTTLSVLFLRQLLYCHLNLYPLPCSLFLVPVIWPVACPSPVCQSCPVWTVWVHFQLKAVCLVCVFAHICLLHLPTKSVKELSFCCAPTHLHPRSTLLPPMQICNISQKCFLQPTDRSTKHTVEFDRKISQEYKKFTPLTMCVCIYTSSKIVDIWCKCWVSPVRFFWMEVQNIANELIYLLRAKFFLWWWRICQSEERGWCRPPTSNLGKDRTTEMSCVKPTRNNMWCWFLENCFCRWFFIFFSWKTMLWENAYCQHWKDCCPGKSWTRTTSCHNGSWMI